MVLLRTYATHIGNFIRNQIIFDSISSLKALRPVHKSMYFSKVLIPVIEIFCI